MTDEIRTDIEYVTRVDMRQGFAELIPLDGKTHLPSHDLYNRPCSCMTHEPVFHEDFAVENEGQLVQKGFYVIRHRPFHFHPSHRAPKNLPEEFFEEG